MKDTILIMSANPYSIEDEGTGKKNEGISIMYGMITDVLPRSEPSGFLGVRMLKGSIPSNQAPELTAVPAFYEAEFIIKSGSNGKAELRPQSVKFKKTIL